MNTKRNVRSRGSLQPLGGEVLPRPLNPRSLIASLLLGMDLPVRRAHELVRWCGLFDVPPGTARVALSRMVERGELGRRDDCYELIGRLRERAPEQRSALHPKYVDWDGTWRLAVVTLDRRDAGMRLALRIEMRRHHFCEQREGVWTRPNNLELGVMHSMDSQCRLWNAIPDADALTFAHDLFGITQWQARADKLMAAYGRLAPISDTPTREQLRDSFLVSAAALSHLRADPLLPAPLLPDSWPGDRLRLTYQARASEFSDAVGRWFRFTA